MTLLSSSAAEATVHVTIAGLEDIWMLIVTVGYQWATVGKMMENQQEKGSCQATGGGVRVLEASRGLRFFCCVGT